MRTLLLLALLLRLAPTPVLADAHCASEESAVPAASHVHHEQSPADVPETDCSHCPPSECADQQGCTVAPATLAATEISAVNFAAVFTRPASRVPNPLLSRFPTPPVPPPLIASA